MDVKKALVVFAVAIMMAVPFVCLADNGSSTSSNGEDFIKTGTNVVFHDLDNEDMKILGWPNWEIPESESNDLPSFLTLGFFFGLFMPGINYGAFESPLNELVVPQFTNFNAELGYSELISSNQSDNVEYRVGLKLSAEKMTFTLTPDSAETILLEPPELIPTWEILFDMLCCGDYSVALLNDYGANKWDGKPVTFTCSFDISIYGESTMKLGKIKDGEYAYLSGGFQSPMVNVTSTQKNYVPFSELYVDIDATVSTTINGKAAQFDTDLNFRSDMDLERTYACPLSEVVADHENGSLYVDRVKDAKLTLSECSKYNGNENGKFLDLDLTNQYQATVDGRLFRLMQNSTYVPGKGLLRLNDIEYSDIAPAAKQKTDGSYDPEVEKKAEELFKLADPDVKYSHDYDESLSKAHDIKNSVTGSSKDNTMLIVGIVIAILIIIAIIALWYFKFRN